MATPNPASCGRRYSVEEIFSLRYALPEVNFIVNEVNKHPDICEISPKSTQMVDLLLHHSIHCY